MPSQRNQKTLIQMGKILNEYSEFFITENNGLTVSNLVSLRKELKKVDSIFHIVKNRIFKIALRDQKIEKLHQHFKGVNGIVFTKDPIKAAKVVDRFIKEHKEKMSIKAGFAEQKEITAAYIKELSTLMSREELISQFLFILKNPVQKLTFGLKQIGDKKEN